MFTWVQHGDVNSKRGTHIDLREMISYFRARILMIMVLGIFAIHGCTEPIEFNFDSQEDVLVVDGYITNQFKSHLIRLSYTSSKVDNVPIPNPVRNARVQLKDDQGEVFDLRIGRPGEYWTPSMFAEEGKSYQLTIEVNGRTYSSSMEGLPGVSANPPLEVEINDQDFRNIEQGRLIVNRRGASLNARILKSTTLGQENVYYQWLVSSCRDFSPFDNPNVRICSVFGNISREPQLYLLQDPFISGLENENYLHELEWFPKPLEGNVSGTFIVEIDQLVIGQKAYNYWSQIEKSIEDSGSIFAPAVSRILGNVSESETGVFTLGYFGVYREASRWQRIRLSGF